MTDSDNDSLLSYIAVRRGVGLEDVATDALSFILNRSASARTAMSDLLADDRGPLPIASANTQEFLESSGAYPDMGLWDADDNILAFVEAKFCAELTRNQPVTYWEALPTDKHTVLLFLVPQSRVDDNYLWDQLVGRLQEAGHELDAPTRSKNVISAASKEDQRCLMLTSWEYLLQKSADRVEQAKDAQAAFEIAELKMLATKAAEGVSTDKYEAVKQVTEDVVDRLVQAGWANRDGLSWGTGFGFFRRFLRLGGASAFLIRTDDALKWMPEIPLWLAFYDGNTDVSATEVRTRLGDKVYSGSELQDWAEVIVPITLRAGIDLRSARDAIIAKLESIARIIDPDGPTYQ